ncbi:hypothetical protein SEVIR_2G113600v4 [Setaria viridis]|uniref:Uncharacterized protein n=2 Tax=Setaria TaxID=4554 RepID=K3ZYI5_SETIT|nr:hypothetical protein SETIT_2G107900v2 [Setaria italica]TKW31560.1 hypothetical protein SEVIR_2G113600v2 [Setaria viridis]TKW31561.1 hypothetical protein SEVIR_2G113600v2 [Setaria viridis]
MAAPPPRRGKDTTRTAWPSSLSLLLPLVLVLLITLVHSRPQGLTSTISGQKGSEFRAWRRDAISWPDRMTDLAPPAPKPNSNVPGGPFG